MSVCHPLPGKQRDLLVTQKVESKQAEDEQHAASGLLPPHTTLLPVLTASRTTQSSSKKVLMPAVPVGMGSARDTSCKVSYAACEYVSIILQITYCMHAG